MNRFLKAGILLAATAAACTSCMFVRVSGDYEPGAVLVASDRLVSRNFKVDDFKSINVNLPCDVKFKVGQKSVSVYAPDNFVDALAFEVDSTGCLDIGIPRNPVLKNFKTVIFTVSAPTLEGLKVNGASDVELEGRIVAPEFFIDINGAAEVEADGIRASKVSVRVRGAGDVDIEDLDCENLELSVSGAGDCTFAGRADNADIEVKGAGDVDLTELRVKNLTKSVKGAGTVRTRR